MWRDADEKGGLNFRRGEGCAGGSPLRRDSFSSQGDVHVAFKMMTRNSMERRITSQRLQGMRKSSGSLEDETVQRLSANQLHRQKALDSGPCPKCPNSRARQSSNERCVNKVPTWLKCAVRWPLSYIGAANVDETRFNQQFSIAPIAANTISQAGGCFCMPAVIA